MDNRFDLKPIDKRTGFHRPGVNSTVSQLNVRAVPQWNSTWAADLELKRVHLVNQWGRSS